ncbi:hypothetical protein [Arthrobacter castelli]|uniref:hypothetical protein n=1 Tax=Arthrobacter castelli TaxID=271431 RepID=UPI0004114D53|nr:hypothetical protein [Arthrobacter castelli]
MADEKRESTTYAELQQRWHGWGSPVGLGLGLFLAAAAIAALMAAASLFVP